MADGEWRMAKVASSASRIKGTGSLFRVPMRYVLLAAFVAIVHSGETRSQTYADVLHPSPAQRAAEAFNTDFGRLVVADIGRALRASADWDCLHKKNLFAPEALARGGGELMVRNGAAILGAYAKASDGKKLDERLAARAGANARAEIERLRGDPEVRKFEALTERARLASLVLFVTETTERHALLARIKFQWPISPLASGNPTLLDADPSDRALDERENLINSSKSDPLKRWLQLNAAMDEAFRESMDPNALLRLGPRELTPETESGLAGLCVFSELPR